MEKKYSNTLLLSNVNTTRAHKTLYGPGGKLLFVQQTQLTAFTRDTTFSSLLTTAAE